MVEIELGDKVKCKYTGFVGIAVARSEFINGCIQISIAPKWDGKSNTIDEMSLDEGSLIVIKKAKKEKDKDSNGGPMRLGIKQRGY